nr:probable apyrase 6 [Tanacetum cinerariifolium]
SFGSKEPVDPCSPKGYKHSLTIGNITPISFVKTNEQLSIPQASGNFSECRSASLTLLQKGKDECAYDQCYIGSTFIPKLQGNFLATENFFHTSKVTPLSSMLSYCLFIYTIN